MIQKFDNLYVLETKDTSYLFEVSDKGHLFQLYYGPKISVTKESAKDIQKALTEKCKYQVGNAIQYDKESSDLVLENRLLEFSGIGKGDIRTPFVELTYPDGSATVDYLYESDEIGEGTISLEGLPYAIEGKNDQCNEGIAHLSITTKEEHYQTKLVLNYVVFYKENIIARSAKLINHGSDSVTIKRLMSLQLDVQNFPCVVTSFGGHWTNEMNRFDTKLSHGSFVNESMTGTTSSRSNPFIMVSKPQSNENAGLCYGFNLLYSGNHRETVEVASFGKTRILTGINPTGFSWKLQPGESFESPQAIMTVTEEGFGGISKNMHAFVREHIVRGVWQYKERPILLNSWEAAYFKFDESKLVKMAQAGKKAGIELFVMDDGWFGKRDNDASSLGDWYVNTKKLPGGLKGISDKIHELGMDFGIWVEPEMVNEDSDLYKAHPDWVLKHPNNSHAVGRNQMILDLTKDEVCNYIIEAMKNVFSSARIEYVKWDMNRIFSDAYSQGLESDRQGEVYHRYVLGLYKILKALTEAFPQILFEGCAAGGNRFDLGALCFFPQIWGSDNTDAYCRAKIQAGYSYGYPLSTVSAHVSSCPNHQTLRETPLETRFAIALAGVLGYECNLAEVNAVELEAIKDQIAFYKKYRKTLQFGDYYRVKTEVVTPFEQESFQFNIVSKDQTESVGVFMQGQKIPNMPGGIYQAKGLKSEALYHFTNRSLKFNIKDFGISLKMNFCGTGYDDDVRCFTDYSARIYTMEQVNNE